MGGEAFDLGEGGDEGFGFAECGAVETDDAGAALELVDGEAWEGFACAACGERVAGACEEVAGGDWAVIADEDGTGGADEGDEFAVVADDEAEVFGGPCIGDGDALSEVFDVDEVAAGFEGGAGDVGAREEFEETGDFLFDGAEEFEGWGGEEDLAVAAVFGLGEEVGGDEVGASGVVGEDHDFAGAWEEVDGDGSEELAFGFDDEFVAWAHDFVDWADGFGAEGECGDGVGSADAVDFGGSGELEGEEHGVVDAAVRAAGRADDDFGDAGGFGEGDRHDDGGDERGGAAGDVDADALEWLIGFADDRALFIFHVPALAETAFGEGDDIAAGGFEGLFDLWRDGFGGGGDDVRWDGEGVGGERGVVELVGEVSDGLVAAGADGVDDVADVGHEFRCGDVAAVEREEIGGEGRGFVAQGVHEWESGWASAA